MSARVEALPKQLIVAVLLMTLVVLALGGAVIAVKLRPDSAPVSTAERVLADWQDAVDEEPNSDTAQTGLGLALLQVGRDREAQTAFETALRLNPDNWMANFQLGLMVQGTDPSRAIELLYTAAKKAPAGDKAVPLVAAGDLLLADGDAEGAKDAYRRSIADVSYLFESHFGLAQALEELGEAKAALEEYRKAGRFDPGNVDIQEAIERLNGTD
ncbi:MAG: tetratricopeptide repeat protein [Actinomycetota bacterium]